MTSVKDDHLSDIISLVQGAPKKKAASKASTASKPAPSRKNKKKAGRKALPAKNRRSEILIVRLTRDEKIELRKIARQNHTTLSSYVRKTSIGVSDDK